MEKETDETKSDKPKDLTEIRKESKHFCDLMEACNSVDKPDPKAREELQSLMRNNPHYKELMQFQDGLYSIALKRRIDTFNCSDAFREVMRAKCTDLRENLSYATANRLEKLAIEQIVLTWLNYHQTETCYASSFSKSSTRDSDMYWEKRLNFASRRYNRALETLAKMRKMNLVVQVNNAQNQVVNNG